MYGAGRIYNLANISGLCCSFGSGLEFHWIIVIVIIAPTTPTPPATTTTTTTTTTVRSLDPWMFARASSSSGPYCWYNFATLKSICSPWLVALLVSCMSHRRLVYLTLRWHILNLWVEAAKPHNAIPIVQASNQSRTDRQTQEAHWYSPFGWNTQNNNNNNSGLLIPNDNIIEPTSSAIDHDGQPDPGRLWGSRRFRHEHWLN